MDFKYKIGDKVIFIGEPDKFTWKPIKYKEYKILDIQYDKYYPFYLIKDDNTYLRFSSFISIKKYRKLKLKKIAKHGKL